MEDPIQQAMDRYGVPAGHAKFLFVLPPFYVAKADGKVSLKEAMSIVWNSLRSGLVGVQGEEKKAFDLFVQNELLQFQGKSSLDDLEILTRGINARLAQYPSDEAPRIREQIHEMCIKVAKASGPLFREKVSAEERQMLDRIFAEI